MGYLTTITFCNDHAQTLRDNPEAVSEAIYNAQLGVQLNRGSDTTPIGSCANPIIIQKPRHADDHTLFMHAGNTVIDVYNAKTEWAVDQFIKEMEYHLKRLKEFKNSKKI
jgi:hypothetical protein